MEGIRAFGAYIPRYRLGKETNGWRAATERATASFDEDSLTMAVAAVRDCLDGQDPKDIDGLFFATSTPPYKEKQSSPTIALASDLREDIMTADFTTSLRAGTIALKAALDAVKAGSARQILVVMADMRQPAPRSEFDTSFGDGAVAFLIGNSAAAATVEDFYTISHEIVDLWRGEGDNFVRSWEDRFVMDKGYFEASAQAATTIMKKNSLSAKDFTKALLYAPDGRRHREMGRRLGFNDNQLLPFVFDQVGNTGAAMAPLLLAAALEEARPGDRFLLLNYGQGADAFIIQVTGEINRVKPRRGVKGHIATKKVMPDYQTYLQWRGLVEVAAAARRPASSAPSAAAMHREQGQNLRLYGVRCQKCGTPQYPEQRVCTICQTADKFDPYKFADKKATLFTYTLDYLSPVPDPPNTLAVIDFDGGGRMLCEMTERDVKEVKIGMPLEMSFRKLYAMEGISNYFWRCIPPRG